MGNAERETRQAIIDACQRMVREGLVTGTAGNISVRRGEQMLITPSGRDYGSLTVDDICLVDLEPGAPIAQGASSEAPLHRIVYRCSAAAAVVHFHGVQSVAVSNTLDALPVEHYYAMRIGGEIDVAPYARFGSERLAASVGAALDGKLAALMQNHGGVAIGRDLAHAYENASLLEWLCALALASRSIGDPRLLTPDEIAEVAFMYERNRLDGRGS